MKVGKVRDYNITKNEWVLNGKTVYYASADTINATLDYDFSQEKKFNYKGLSKREVVEHIANFVSGLWQIHAFGEGNTRTIAVFTIKYLRTFGFEVENDMFAKHSWYFRNALVRANYNDYEHKIYATLEYLMRFFGNLLLGENNELKNRYLRIDYVDSENAPNKSDINSTDKLGEKENTPNLIQVDENKKLGVKLNKNQLKILELIRENEKITITEMAKKLSISTTAIENNIKKLREKNIISREGSDKSGFWKVTIGGDN